MDMSKLTQKSQEALQQAQSEAVRRGRTETDVPPDERFGVIGRATAQAERDANRESWLRTQAELENYRKRVQREMDEARRYQVLPLARDVLPAIEAMVVRER